MGEKKCSVMFILKYNFTDPDNFVQTYYLCKHFIYYDRSQLTKWHSYNVPETLIINVIWT